MSSVGKPQLRIYNLYPRNTHLYEWSGRFVHAKGLGCNTVQVPPVLKNSGHIYEITDHESIAPEFIDKKLSLTPEDQLRFAVEMAHFQQMLIIMELPLNHTSANHPFVADAGNGRKGWYQMDAAGKFVRPNISDGSQPKNSPPILWNGVYNLDYTNREVRKYIISIMDKWAKFGFDGFMCKYAPLIPNTFWQEAIQEIKSSRSSFLFLAETFECETKELKNILNAGFDYYTNSTRWGRLLPEDDYFTIDYINELHDRGCSISFPETFETARLINDIVMPEQYRNSNNYEIALKLRCTVAALLSAGVMIPDGYESGYTKRIDLKKPYQTKENTGIDITDHIRKVNGMKSSYKVFGEEVYISHDLPNNNEKVRFFKKSSDDGSQTAYILINTDVEHTQPFKTEYLNEVCDREKKPIKELRDISPDNFTVDGPNGTKTLGTNGTKALGPNETITLERGEVKVFIHGPNDKPIEPVPSSSLKSDKVENILRDVNGLSHDAKNAITWVVKITDIMSDFFDVHLKEQISAAMKKNLDAIINVVPDEATKSNIAAITNANLDAIMKTKKKDMFSADINKIFAVHDDCAHHLEFLTGELQNIEYRFKADNNDIQLNQKPLSLHKFLEDVRNIFVENNKNVIIDPLTLEGELLSANIYADEDWLKCVMYNLIGNAIDHTPRSGHVKISAKIIGDFIEISISDTGEGIEANILPMIFTPKVKGTNSRGKGLGLSNAKRIVDKHGGEIRFVTEAGKGTTFYYTVPIAKK